MTAGPTTGRDAAAPSPAAGASAPPPTLEQSYACCRALSKRHGTTYYWAGLALPAVKRHHVWALYAFCRYADDIVDDLGPAPVADRSAALERFGATFFDDLRRGRSDHLVLKAVVHTVRAFDIDPQCFRRFLRSMTMDLTIRQYETWDDLLAYMDGSAAVIGEMMLPILEPRSTAAVHPAQQLGNAFQLTNFLRDVGEDLERDRVYVPQEDLLGFGADPHRRRVDEPWRRLMCFEIERCRDLYADADRGVDDLPPASARCVAAARRLYSGILDEIEDADFDVFSSRVRVPAWRKVLLGARAAASTRRGR